MSQKGSTMQKIATQAYMEGAAAALSAMDIDDSIKQASMDRLYEAAEYLGKGIVNPLGGEDQDYLRSAAGLGTAGLAGYGLYRAATSDAAKRYYDNLGKGVKNVATGNFGDIDKDQAIAMAGTGLGVGALAYGGKKLHEGYKLFKDTDKMRAKLIEWGRQGPSTDIEEDYDKIRDWRYKALEALNSSDYNDTEYKSISYDISGVGVNLEDLRLQGPFSPDVAARISKRMARIPEPLRPDIKF